MNTITLIHSGVAIGELVAGTWPAHGDNYIHAFWDTGDGYRSVEAFDYSVNNYACVLDSDEEVNCPECLAQFARWQAADVAAKQHDRM